MTVQPFFKPITLLLALIIFTFFLSSGTQNIAVAQDNRTPVKCGTPVSSGLVPTNTPVNNNNIPATVTPKTPNCGSKQLVHIKSANVSSSAKRVPTPTPTPVSFFQDFSTQACETLGEPCVTQTGAGTFIGLPGGARFFPEITNAAYKDISPQPGNTTSTLQVTLTLTPNDNKLYDLTGLNYFPEHVFQTFGTQTDNDVSVIVTLEFLDLDLIPVKGTTITCNEVILNQFITNCYSFGLNVKGVKSIRFTRTATIVNQDISWFEDLIDNVSISGAISQVTPPPPGICSAQTQSISNSVAQTVPNGKAWEPSHAQEMTQRWAESRKYLTSGVLAKAHAQAKMLASPQQSSAT